jgi:hypothetical protein
MDMILHEAVQIHSDLMPFNTIRKRFKKPLAVPISLENGPTLIATKGHVIHGTLIFDSYRSSHATYLLDLKLTVKLKTKERADP